MSTHRSHETSPAWLFASLLAIVVAVSLGCDERVGTSTVIPSGGGSDSQLKPEGDFEGESIDELALRLEQLSTQQRAKVSAGAQDPARCEELCELSQAICEIKSKMCELADERDSDDEYQNLCRQAKQRCQEASQSCVRCVEHHQNSSPLRPRQSEPEPASCGGE